MVYVHYLSKKLENRQSDISLKKKKKSDNWTFNLSLTLTSVASNTIISSTTSLWTLILTSLLGVEKFTWFKLFGIFGTLAGVTLVAISDSNNTMNESIWGDLLAIISAITYAIYVAAFKKIVKEEHRVNNAMFLGNTATF